MRGEHADLHDPYGIRHNCRNRTWRGTDVSINLLAGVMGDMRTRLRRTQEVCSWGELVVWVASGRALLEHVVAAGTRT